MPDAYVAAGSNADAWAALALARRQLAAKFGAVSTSSVYRGADHSGLGAPYLNAVLRVSCALPPSELAAWLREVEALAGRDRSRRDLCALDLDLLLHGEAIGANPPLPHPWLREYPHFLLPLAELAPDLRYPGSGERLTDLAAARAAAGVDLQRVGAL